MNTNTYRKLLAAHQDRIYSYALYFLRDQDDAEDVTQEVFLRLWKNGGALDPAKAEAWLVRVAHNLCVDQTRRHRTVRTYLGRHDVDALDQIPEPRDAWTNPEQELDRSVLRQEILDAMDTLQDETRSVMLMHYFQGLRLQDIARTLGKKTSTVKVQVHRARKALRLVLDSGVTDCPDARQETG